MTTHRAVFLDRDGTLNRVYRRDHVEGPPRSVAELELLPGVPEAIGLLRDAGLALIVVTNQPDVARGDLPRATAEAINRALLRQLSVDAVLACFHDDVDGCECRKPKPGLLVQAADEMGLNLDASFMVGDRWRDTGAGRRAGCTTIQIRTTSGERSTEGEPDFWVACLPEAATLILEKLRLQRI